MDMQAYAETVARYFSEFDATLLYEPGRYITGDAGILLPKSSIKQTFSGCTFVIWIQAWVNCCALHYNNTSRSTL